MRSCGPGFHRSTKSGRCRPDIVKVPGVKASFQRLIPGGATGFTVAPGVGVGTAGLAGPHSPMLETRTVLECGPGFVLGKDEQCYAKGTISNKLRKWPRGRKPLGTPGELAALAKAASFGRRMESTVKRMQKIGVLKKPRRAVSKRPTQKLIGPGGTSIINVE